MEKLVLEINEKNISDKDIARQKKTSGILITPPIDENFWIFRVKLFEDQAIVGFPKFNTIGIGFAIEDDWNTNFPYTEPAEKICNHIWHNRRYIAIKRKRTIRAIEMMQAYIKSQRANEND